MAATPKKKPSAILGLVLILLLLTAVALGGIWVVRKAFQPRMSDARAAQETPAQPAAQSAPVTGTQTAAQEAPAPVQPAQETGGAARVTLMALGDDLIHNCVYWSAQTPEGGYDFSPFFDDIRPIVQQYDIACINQETILVEDRDLIESYPVFGTPVEIADALAGAGFDVVTLASNHCFDKKETGVNDTLAYFHTNYPEITTLGIHDSAGDAEKIPVVEKNGIRIAMLNFTYGLNNSMPANDWMVDMLSGKEAVCARIEQAREQADFVIVFPHWGTEDTFTPDDNQLSWAQAMADAGAGLIIGGHTHTLQPVELLTSADGRDVPVYYSLGNFLSHQTEKINLLGGMAAVTIVQENGETWVESYELKGTVNLILRNTNTGWYDYRPMLLEHYTPALAAQNRFTECTADAMRSLFDSIVS